MKWPSRNAEGSPICDRCSRQMNAFSMSYFNTDLCCFDCLRIEKEHPDYERARTAELRAVQSGDSAFPGVGAPPDLRNASST